MVNRVTLPNGDYVDFPDGTSPEEMEAALADFQSANQRQFAEASPVSREDYPGLGAERDPIEGPSLEMRPGLSPVEKMLSGYLENAQQSIDMLGRQTGMPMPTVFDPKDPPRFGVGREAYPIGFAPGETVPLTGMTPRELFPLVAGGAAQVMFPPARGLGALGEIGVNTLTGVAGENIADAGLRMAEGDSLSRIGMDALDGLPQDVLQYGLGATLAKGAGMGSELLFGRPASRSGQRAIDFARQNRNVGVTARAEGSPRLPLDAVTEGKGVALTRLLLSGEHGSNVKARQSAKWINNVLEGQAKFRFVNLPSGKKVQGIPTREQLQAGTARLMEEMYGDAAPKLIGDTSKPASQWMNELFVPKNVQLLENIKTVDPDVHALLLARHLTDRINKFTTEDATYGRVLDGTRLYNWAKDNAMDLRRMYGPRAATNVLNFAEYAKYVDDINKQAIATERAGFKTSQVGRLALETTALAAESKVALPLQMYAWGLSHALMDPGSFWFKVFQNLPKADKPVQQAIRTSVAVDMENDGE